MATGHSALYNPSFETAIHMWPLVVSNSCHEKSKATKLSPAVSVHWATLREFEEVGEEITFASLHLFIFLITSLHHLTLRFYSKLHGEPHNKLSDDILIDPSFRSFLWAPHGLLSLSSHHQHQCGQSIRTSSENCQVILLFLLHSARHLTNRNCRHLKFVRDVLINVQIVNCLPNQTNANSHHCI